MFDPQDTLDRIACALGCLTDRIVTVDLGTTETAYDILATANGQKVIEGEHEIVTKACGGVIYMARRPVQS
jgi:hypothetical protein